MRIENNEDVFQIFVIIVWQAMGLFQSSSCPCKIVSALFIHYELLLTEMRVIILMSLILSIFTGIIGS